MRGKKGKEKEINGGKAGRKTESEVIIRRVN